jgi:DNA primase
MMTVEELAQIVSRTVKLGRSGRERWSGLCPFHSEKTPSFQIWRGRRGEGRYHCHGCGADGDAADWMRLFHGQRVTFKPDPEILKERAREKRRERLRQSFYNVYPDACPEWDFILRSIV